MIEKTYNDTNVKYYVSKDGKALAKFEPKQEEKWVIRNGRKCRVQRERKFDVLYINTNRTRYGGDWWEKSYLERIKPEYKEELEELIKMYPNAKLSEYCDV